MLRIFFVEQEFETEIDTKYGRLASIDESDGQSMWQALWIQKGIPVTFHYAVSSNDTVLYNVMHNNVTRT
jgi:hypothetical protein